MGTDLLALRRKSKISQLIHEVPRDERYLPHHPLPGWDQFAVGDKLPNHENPILQKAAFSREKIGHEIYNLSKMHFDLSDPYLLQKTRAYEPLHDAALKHYFTRKPILRTLQNLGLVDEEGAVLCSQKEFNAYRRYLADVHLSRVNQWRTEYEMNKFDEKYFHSTSHKSDVITKKCDHDMKIADKKARLQRMDEEKHQETVFRITEKLNRYNQRNCMKKAAIVPPTKESLQLIEIRKLRDLQARIELKERIEMKERLRLRKLQERDQYEKHLSYEKSVDHFKRKFVSMCKHDERNKAVLQTADHIMAKKIVRHHSHAVKLWNEIEVLQIKNKAIGIRRRYPIGDLDNFMRLIGEEFRRVVRLEELRTYDSFNLERAGLNPIVIDSFEEGTHKNLYVITKYRVSVTDKHIKQSVQTSMHAIQLLLGAEYAVTSVIKIVKYIIFRIANGISEKLPIDEEVKSFIKDHIRKFVKKIADHALDIVSRAFHREQQSSITMTDSVSRKSSLSTHSKDFKTKVKFTEHVPLYDSVKTAKTTEKAVNLRRLIRAEFETDFEDTDSISLDLNNAKLFHLTGQQKQLISEKLKYFYHFMLQRTERLVFRRVDLVKMRIIPEKKLTQQDLPPPSHPDMSFADIIESAAIGLLTPSYPNNAYSAENIVRLSNNMHRTILEDMKAMIDKENSTRKQNAQVPNRRSNIKTNANNIVGSIDRRL